MEKLKEEHPELDLARAFDDAKGLHINFYEDHLSEATMKRRCEAVKEFVRKMEKFL